MDLLLRIPSAARERVGPAALAHRLAFAVVLLSFLATGLYYNIAIPIWETPDEPQHYMYVEHIVRTHTLPVRENSAGNQYHQPPLYYLIGSLAVGWLPLDELAPGKLNPYFIWNEPRLGEEPNVAVHTYDELPPFQGTALAVHILRAISLLFCAVGVWAAYAIARAILPNRPWLAVAAAAFTAFVPQYLFVSASGGNDGPAIAFASLVLLSLVTMARDAREGKRISYRRFALLGLWVGLGMLSKLTFYGVAPVIALTALFVLAIGRPRLRLLGGWFLSGGIALALAGWWYLRNVIVYATGLAILGEGRFDPRTFRDIPEKPDEVARVLSWYPEPLFQSFWLRFGWMDISPSQWVYDLAAIFSGLVLVGCLVFLVRQATSRKRVGASAAVGLTICFLALLSAFAVTTWRFAYTLGNAYPQGRYLFVAQPATSLLAVMGLSELLALPALLAGLVLRRPNLLDSLRRAVAPVAAIAFALAFLTIGVGAADKYVVGQYQYVPIWLHFDESTLPNKVQADFANQLELIGYDLHASEVARGQTAVLDLYWRTRGNVDQDYQCFVHVADASGKPVTQKDAPAGNGVALTSKWEPGEVIRERREIPIGDDVPPGEYRLLVGVYSLQDMKRLPLTGASGGDTVSLGSIV
ncbi:MAG: ArnT family glycosyltransferase, partial [Chloroflexota bacterium]